MKKMLIIIMFLFGAICSKAQEKQVIVPYTLADRDRIIHVEEKIANIESRLNSIDSQLIKADSNNNSLEKKINNRIDRLEDKFMWGFGLLLMSILALFGFIVYDRRVTLAPLESKTDRIIKVLKDSAEKDPDLKESLKRTSLW